MLWLLCIPALGIAYHLWGSWRDRRQFPPPGRRSNGLHACTQGAGSPVIVFEAGIASSCLSWSRVQPEAAKLAATIAYDRAGFGWSDARRGARIPSQLARELHELLQANSAPPPYILVAHSFGAMIVDEFARIFPSECAGMVWVDPIRPEEWSPGTGEVRQRLAKGARLARRGGLLARLGILRFTLRLAVSGSRWIPMLAARAASGGAGSSAVGRLAREVAKLPPEIQSLVAMHWRQPRSFGALARYLADLPEAAGEALRHRSRVTVPLIIIRASGSAPFGIDGDFVREIEATQPGHWIHFDEPELVVAAIKELVNRRSEDGGTSA